MADEKKTPIKKKVGGQKLVQNTGNKVTAQRGNITMNQKIGNFTDNSKQKYKNAGSTNVDITGKGGAELGNIGGMKAKSKGKGSGGRIKIGDSNTVSANNAGRITNIARGGKAVNKSTNTLTQKLGMTPKKGGGKKPTPSKPSNGGKKPTPSTPSKPSKPTEGKTKIRKGKGGAQIRKLPNGNTRRVLVNKETGNRRITVKNAEGKIISKVIRDKDGNLVRRGDIENNTFRRPGKQKD